MIRYLVLVVIFTLRNDAKEYGNPNLTIARGTHASIEKYPFMISIHNTARYLCGGVILSHRFVTTAAHCVVGQDAESIFIRVGSDIRESGTIYRINLIILQSAYNSSHVHDIAIMRLTKTLEYNKQIAFVKLPESDMEMVPGQECTILGYGNRSPKINGSDLTSAKVYVFSNEDCKEYNRASMLPFQFCAGDLNSATGSCLGDSGGALIINNMLLGIVSWGIGDCAISKHPGIYVNVRYYVEFLNIILSDC